MAKSRALGFVWYDWKIHDLSNDKGKGGRSEDLNWMRGNSGAENSKSLHAAVFFTPFCGGNLARFIIASWLACLCLGIHLVLCFDGKASYLRQRSERHP